MVKGECFTNLDNFRNEIWPSIFARVPNKGESVKSKTGKRLHVVNIIHSECERTSGEPFDQMYHTEPYIIVELHRV